MNTMHRARQSATNSDWRRRHRKPLRMLAIVGELHCHRPTCRRIPGCGDALRCCAGEAIPGQVHFRGFNCRRLSGFGPISDRLKVVRANWHSANGAGPIASDGQAARTSQLSLQ
jgi:hypothetical protein